MQKRVAFNLILIMTYKRGSNMRLGWCVLERYIKYWSKKTSNVNFNKRHSIRVTHCQINTAISVLVMFDLLVCKNQVAFKNCKKEVCFQWKWTKKVHAAGKRVANHPPAINPFEPILLSQIYWDFLFVSYSPSFVSNKIFPVDWRMFLHCAPSHKCSLFHHFY